VPIGNLLAFFQYNVPYFTLALAGIFSLCYYNNISIEKLQHNIIIGLFGRVDFSQIFHTTSLWSLVSKCLSIVQQVYFQFL